MNDGCSTSLMGMAPSRRIKNIDYFRTENTRTEPVPPKPQRHCIDCGAVMTWNPDDRCCSCQDNYEENVTHDRRHKLRTEHLIEIEETMDTMSAAEQAARYGVHHSTISRIRKGMREARE
jgi:predicted nucleic acid-binding Zn ribbon protein